MHIRIANPTRAGGEVQLWPIEWQAILSVLPTSREGQLLVPIIRQAIAAGGGNPVRIPMTTRQIATLEAAMAKLA